MKRRLSLVVALVVVVGCAGLAPPPYPARPPASLPPGAQWLAIRTASPAIRGTGAPETCPDALMERVTLVRDGDQLIFLVSDTGRFRPVVWPRGFSARLYQGQAELVAPDGSVIAVEGDALDGIGGAGPLPDAFAVCTVGSTTYGPAS